MPTTSDQMSVAAAGLEPEQLVARRWRNSIVRFERRACACSPAHEQKARAPGRRLTTREKMSDSSVVAARPHSASMSSSNTKRWPCTAAPTARVRSAIGCSSRMAGTELESRPRSPGRFRQVLASDDAAVAQVQDQASAAVHLADARLANKTGAKS
jgi:hypothetical protein